MGNQWWLRAQDEVFGPVTRDNLLEWAQMGRIQPGQDVSEDGENWKPATEIAFLDMRWSIDIGDGTPRGPFNKQAAQALLASGRLPRGSKLVEVVPEPVDQKAEPEPAPQKDEPAAQSQSACVDEPKVASSNEIAELRQQLETLQAGLRAAEARAAEAERRVDEVRREASEAESMAKAAESDLADLFSSAQANEAAYENRIQSLSEEIKRLPPTAQLAADAQAAVYALMKEEADELAAALEAENREAEAFRQYRRQRTERLLARRQEILRRLGTDVDDMTRRALKAHPEDPRTAHLRQELDALRVLQERSTLEADRRIRELSSKLRESTSEVKRLREQAADVTVIYRQLQEAREKLSAREKDLVEERQKSEIERQQHAAAQQALLTRLSSLEMGMPGATNQSREARSVRLAPWMGLKK